MNSPTILIGTDSDFTVSRPAGEETGGLYVTDVVWNQRHNQIFIFGPTFVPDITKLA